MARNISRRNRDDLLAVVIGIVVIATLHFASSILIPIALAILFAFILTTFAKLLERARLGRIFSALFVVFFSVAAIGAVGWTVTKQFAGVMEDLPNYSENISDKIATLRGAQRQTLGNASNTISELGKELASPPGETATSQAKRAGGLKSATQARPLPVEVIKTPALPFESLQGVLSLLISAGLVIVFTLFMIIRREDLRNRFISLAGTGRMNAMTQALDDAGDRISRYLRLQLVVNTCYGVIVGIGLHFIGLPGALLWGVIAGILRFIPYLGPPLGGIAPLLLSLAIFPGWDHALMTLGLFVVTELSTSNLVEPFLYGEHTGLSPVAVLLATVFWTALWGPIGLVLSTPLTVCLVVLGRYVPRLGFLHTLLGDEPVLSPDARFYQRLLAMDHQEAKEVLEACLKDKNLEEVYGSVLIPALSMAEQDRHRNELDEVTGAFICQSTRELIEELHETCDRDGKFSTASNDEERTSHSDLLLKAPVSPSIKIVCLPARDEADEIVAIMLSHVLQRAGYQAQAISIGTTAEMLAEVSESEPDIVCLSALPPFAVSHARSLYKKLRAQYPKLRIIVGLWNFSGDPESASRRMEIREEGTVFTLLSQVVQIVGVSSESAAVLAGQKMIRFDGEAV